MIAIYNISDKFLYEILDDYKAIDNKKEIFDEFIRVIFKCSNIRQITVKNIKFKVLDDMRTTLVGQVFAKYENVPFFYSKTKTNNKDFISLIRQKINNLYNNYCEEKICTRKEYMELIKYPKQLYHQWINNDGFTLTSEEIDQVINDKLKFADDVKLKYSKQKMKLKWKDYKDFVYQCLEKAFNNFICLDDFEDKQKFVLSIDTWNEDNFCVRYLCRCLDGGIRDFQKKYYGLYKKGKRSKRTYARCEDCGRMFLSNKNATKTYRCKDCQVKQNKISRQQINKKYYNSKIRR